MDAVRGIVEQMGQLLNRIGQATRLSMDAARGIVELEIASSRYLAWQGYTKCCVA